MTEQWRYEKLTWPEINQAITAQKIAICPIGSTEQHGPTGFIGTGDLFV